MIVQINDEYYAIQTKFKQNPNTVIKWDELGTFFGLSFGVAEKIKEFDLIILDEICSLLNHFESDLMGNKLQK